jgi:hypothetical protein
MAEPICVKLGMYVMAPESILTLYFENPSHRSVFVCVYPPVVARQLFAKNVTVATNTRNNRIIVESAVFCAVRVISKDRRRLVLPRTSWFLVFNLQKK